MQTVLVTGGSSGLGLAISTRFAQQGATLLWVSHDAEELERGRDQLRQLHPDTTVHTLVQDLTEAQAAEQVHAWATSTVERVDVLVNNAGFGNHGPVHTQDVQREIAMIHLNAIALYALTRCFLSDMRARDAGTIVQISSNSSFQPIPLMATYAATKGFVTQFSRALSEELRMEGSGVAVVTLCPAAIADTPFRKVNDMDRVQTFDGLATTTTAEVTRDLFRALATGQRFVVSGWRQRALMWLRPFLPHRVMMMLVRRETAIRG
ncbi:MAG: SDR family NAD(P)-dependent oxidoreductase [Myxococcales bacterium]|nr:SDR family NAD(P)-dependent oxidoreductase [Myxococcales bacterium]